MFDISITSLLPEQTESAVSILARAFVTNPLHVAAFGPSRLDSNEVFFRIGLNAMKGRKLIATDDTRILGVAHWVHSDECQFSGPEKVRTLPAMIRGFGLRTGIRVLTWVSTWSRHDPAEPHCHLGPIGVDPDAQGRRIGSLLMETYCEDLGRMGVAGYLETDRRSNVAFYERFGFTVSETALVLGVENYFMRRAR
jgi:ribosomal protein S18 acetylase RimI-like enzyme